MKPLELDNKSIKELPNNILLLGRIGSVSERRTSATGHCYYIATIECNGIQVFYTFTTEEQHKFLISKIQNNQIAFELGYEYYKGKKLQKIIRLEHPSEWQYQDQVNRQGLA